MTRRPRLLMLLPALALVVSGCGGDDTEEPFDFSNGEAGSSDAKPYVEAMATSLSEDEDSPMDEEQATCFSQGFVDVVGLKEIEKTGTAQEWADQSDDLDFTKMKLSKDQGNKIYDNFATCGVDMRETMLADFAGDDSMDAETKKCVEDAVTDDNLREFVVTVMVEGEDSVASDPQGLMGELMGCVVGQIGGEPSPGTD